MVGSKNAIRHWQGKLPVRRKGCAQSPQDQILRVIVQQHVLDIRIVIRRHTMLLSCLIIFNMSPLEGACNSR